MAQTVKPNTLATSSLTEVCIWDIAREVKLFEVEEMSLWRAVPFGGKFYGVKNDGKLYSYVREIKEEEPM